MRIGFREIKAKIIPGSSDLNFRCVAQPGLEHSVRGGGVGSSNLPTPTKIDLYVKFTPLGLKVDVNSKIFQSPLTVGEPALTRLMRGSSPPLGAKLARKMWVRVPPDNRME